MSPPRVHRTPDIKEHIPGVIEPINAMGLFEPFPGFHFHKVMETYIVCFVNISKFGATKFTGGLDRAGKVRPVQHGGGSSPLPNRSAMAQCKVTGIAPCHLVVIVNINLS